MHKLVGSLGTQREWGEAEGDAEKRGRAEW